MDIDWNYISSAQNAPGPVNNTMKKKDGYFLCNMIHSIIFQKGIMLNLVLGGTVIFFLMACERNVGSYAKPSPTINVITTMSILEDWVSRVGGENVNVRSIVPSNVDPHTFRPTPVQIGQIEEADIIFLIGEGYEGNWLNKLSSNLVSERGKIVHLSESVNLLEYKGYEDKDHATKRGEFDPHFWHDPLISVDAINEIARKLNTLDISKKSTFTKNATIYVNELIALDKWISSEVSKIPPEKRLLVTNHQTMGYFASKYGFRILGNFVEGLSTEKNHTIKGMITIMDKIKDSGLDVVFSEMQIPDKIAKTISDETNVTIIPLHSESLGLPGSNSDTYIKMIRSNVHSIVNGLSNSL